MNTRTAKLLRTSIVMALALLVLAPLASFAGSLSVSVGFGGPAYYGSGYAPGPGYVWVPGCYRWRPAVGNVWVPGSWVAPRYAGAVWVGPHWGWRGGHRFYVSGYWGHRGYHHHGYYRRW